MCRYVKIKKNIFSITIKTFFSLGCFKIKRIPMAWPNQEEERQTLNTMTVTLTFSCLSLTLLYLKILTNLYIKHLNRILKKLYAFPKTKYSFIPYTGAICIKIKLVCCLN